MRILFFSRADISNRSTFYAHYVLQNLKTLKAFSLIYFVFSLLFRAIFLLCHLSDKKILNMDRYDSANWLSLIVTPIFFLISVQLVKKFKPSPTFLKISQAFVILFSLFLIFSTMRASFFTMHNPRNTMMMYMLGLILTALFFAFEYYETIFITLVTGIIFSITLSFYRHEVDELVLNNLASLVLLISFFSISRLLFSYRADNFFKLKSIEEKNIEIENAIQVKNEILGVVAHDLRNPLATIQSVTMLMEMDGEVDEEYVDNMQMIKTACDKANSIINDLLETAQNELITAFQLEKTEIDQYLASIINEWLKNKKGQINIIYNNPGDFIYAYINKEKMQRVIDNLVINSIKFSGDSNRIEVTLRTLNKEVFIDIKDFGIGIPTDLLPYIFDRFSKARRIGTRGEASFGLGLSIVQQIVKNHNGEISVLSSEDSGTTFTIKLPQVNA